ncbi:MAG: Si-specific NAD(P)(+) transhydrogenase [Verrucomicrobia bacterium]|nr:Si-specific NAD(P)(+) transhydrogenase [Verrucomicrobiota bacterium]
MEYELIVIGTGPAGEKAAVKAAYFGHKVAIIEKEKVFGGAGTYTGTLPSKSLRETALYLSGKHEKGVYGIERGLSREATVSDFLYLKNFVCASAGAEVFENLKRHGIDIYHGTASFEDPHTIRVGEQVLRGDNIIIATGSYPYHPANIPFDGKRIFDSDTILEIDRFPSTLCIVGAGVIGCEYATIFATMGTKVYLVNDKDKILSHLDHEISEELIHQMRSSGIEILFNVSLKEVVSKEGAVTQLSNGQTLTTDMFLFAAGRSGNIKALHLEKAGVQTGPREVILVDNHFRTNVPHIFAVGDVIGFPALASVSMDQGRVAVAHIFHTRDLEILSPVMPLGVYTVPEVSMVGMTEEEAREVPIDYMVGRARYADMARGRIMGAKSGFLKLVFDKSTLTVLGVHIIGNIAVELIHYGVMLIKDRKNLYDVIGEPFNFPTLHDLYKYAAYDGLSVLAGHKIKP